MSDQTRLRTAVVVSLLMHLSLLWMWAAYRVAQEILRQSRPIDIDVVSMPPPAPPAPPRPAQPAHPVQPAPQAQPAEPAPPVPPAPVLQRQIVSPSDAGEEKPPPPDTRLLSDRDNVVAKESAQVGEGAREKDNAPPKPVQESAPPPKPEAPRKVIAEPKPEAKPEPPERRRDRNPGASLPNLDQLLPQVGDLALAGGGSQERDRGADSNSEARRKLSLPQAEAFSARPGIRDFLPAVRPSDITMLNTKADRFAPFVRRVAQRVFQHLDIRLRQAIGGVGQGGKEFAIVEAIMDKRGRLVDARIVERDSTSALSADRILLGATEPDIFFDENPPPGAEAADGKIHFKLLIDLEVVAYQDPRSGRTSGGYHGMAGVGLD